MLKLRKLRPMEKGRENNLLWSVGFILIISCGCALFTALTIEHTLNQLSHSNSMAMLIIDGKDIVSDDGTTGEQLTNSKHTLLITLEVSYAIVSACLIMGIGLIVRIVKRL